MKWQIMKISLVSRSSACFWQCFHHRSLLGSKASSCLSVVVWPDVAKKWTSSLIISQFVLPRLKRSKYQLKCIVPLAYMELTHRFHLHTHSPDANFKVQCMYRLRASLSASIRAAVTGNCTGRSDTSMASFNVLPAHLDWASQAELLRC